MGNDNSAITHKHETDKALKDMMILQRLVKTKVLTAMQADTVGLALNESLCLSREQTEQLKTRVAKASATAPSLCCCVCYGFHSNGDFFMLTKCNHLPFCRSCVARLAHRCEEGSLVESVRCPHCRCISGYTRIFFQGRC